MDGLKHFILPISGMNEGEHFYEFLIDQEFFSHFEKTPLNNGQIKVNLIVDKRPGFIALNFTLTGNIEVECDRCTANIDLPIDREYESVIKMSNVDQEDVDKMADVIYISPFAEEFSVASLTYEIICLSIPMTRNIDCESRNPRPCNMAVLEILNKQETTAESPQNIFKEAFKNINFE